MNNKCQNVFILHKDRTLYSRKFEGTVWDILECQYRNRCLGILFASLDCVNSKNSQVAFLVDQKHTLPVNPLDCWHQVD